jgi:two-component system chemotaxis response regulator CheY
MRAKRSGADGYILKPFDRAYLTEQFTALMSAEQPRRPRLA